MIELSAEQRQAIEQHMGQPLRLVDPASQQTFVLLPSDVYDRLTGYDDEPWTDEERDALAAEVDQMLADDMAIEDNEQ
jgi:hypothetical protein